MAITPSTLNTSEFKSGLGEIVNLVSDASEKTNPKVIAHIEKFSKKAQDEIYGRFNEAFNNGVKDAAKGRKFLEDNLDFRSLTEKVTEVAEDIELAGKIYKLFTTNAPIQTIHGQYNKLSLSARKEIEKHLTTKAEKAKSKELQTALVTVFNGMGRLASETIPESPSNVRSKTSSSSSSSSKTSSKPTHSSNTTEPADDSEPATIEEMLQNPEIQKQVQNGILLLIKTVKKDIDLANAHGNILNPKGGLTQENIVARDEGIPKLFPQFSKPAKCMIEKILIEKSQGTTKPYTSADEATPDHLREAIHVFFDVYAAGSINYKRLSENWKFNEEEAISTQFYHSICRDFYGVLPHYTGNKPSVTDKEFVKLAEAQYSKLTNTNVQAYLGLMLQGFQLPYKKAEAVIRKEKHFITNILDHIQNPAVDRKRSIELYNALTGVPQNLIQAYLDMNHNGITFQKASKPQMIEAANAYMTSLVQSYVENQQEAEALQTMTMSFAASFLNDCNILRQNVAFFKISEEKYNQDQKKVLDIFDSLSPFGRLLVEQELICSHSRSLSAEKTKQDTMRALIAETAPDHIKKAMLSLIVEGFDRNVTAGTIMYNMKPENLGTLENLLLKAYLGYPRYITFAFLQSNFNGSVQDLAKYLSKNMESLHKTTIDEFKNIMAEIKKQQKEGLAKLSKGGDFEEKKRVAFANHFFTKKDFFDEIMALREETPEM